MDRSDFQNACEGYADEDKFLHFQDIVEISHQAMLELHPEVKKMQKTRQDKLGDEIHWLELLCWVDVEKNTVEFYGIKPSGVFLKTGEFMDQIPTIQLEGDPGDFSEQPFHWDGIHSIIRQYNVEIGTNACAPPFLRMSVDETRTNSIYYRLLKYDYDTFELKV